MKRYRLSQLPDSGEGHIFSSILPGKYLCAGALSFKPSHYRAHTNDGPGSSDRHVHTDREAFVLVQGKAQMELDGEMIPMVPGDVLVIEPGEDHHITSDDEDPCVIMWLHAGPQRHRDQLPKESA